MCAPSSNPDRKVDGIPGAHALLCQGCEGVKLAALMHESLRVWRNQKGSMNEAGDLIHPTCEVNNQKECATAQVRDIHCCPRLRMREPGNRGDCAAREAACTWVTMIH